MTKCSRYHGLDLTNPLPPFSSCKLVTTGRGEQEKGLQNSRLWQIHVIEDLKIHFSNLQLEMRKFM